MNVDILTTLKQNGADLSVERQLLQRHHARQSRRDSTAKTTCMQLYFDCQPPFLWYFCVSALLTVFNRLALYKVAMFSSVY